MYFSIWTNRFCPIIFFVFISIFSNAQTIYITTSTTLYRLNLEQCTYQFVVDMEVMNVSDITFLPDGTLIGINRSGALFEIDTISGDTFLLYKFSGQLFDALTTSSSGTIYATGRNGALWTFDVSTGIAMFLGNIGFGYGGDLAFYKGELYMTSVFDDLIIRVDLDNLANSNIVMTNAGGEGGGMYGIVTYAEDCNDVRFYGIVSGNYTVVAIDLDALTIDTVCILDQFFTGAATSHEFIASAPVKARDTIISHPDCGVNNGMITINAIGGTPPYEYSINGNPSQTLNSFQNLSANEYEIVITDSRGCFSTLNLKLMARNIILIDSIQITEKTCDLNNGQISVSPIGNDQLSYSIDSLNFQASNIFDQLDEGLYDIYVRNDSGCLQHTLVTVTSVPPAVISEVNVTTTSCGQPNGSIQIHAVNGNSISYSINDLDFQNDSEFNHLAPGDYLVSILDENGCRDTQSVRILPGTFLSLDTIVINNPACGKNNGSIDINIIGATGLLSYTLNGASEQMNSFFTQLSEGSYSWAVTDEAGCTLAGEVDLINAEIFSIEKITTTNADCGANNGSIEIKLNNPGDTITITINGVQVENNRIEMLGAGAYDLSFTDENGCTLVMTATVDQNPCEIFIPNIFSPNGDGINDYFQITNGDNQARIIKYLIFDRWGNLVYSAGDFRLTDQDSWWDGNFKNIKASPGTYAYFIEFGNNDGTKRAYKGDITLVR